MRKVFVDLEMCPIPKEYAAEKEICKLEIIEIGAVMLDEEGEEIASFKEYVKPAYAAEIPGNIEKLTGIHYGMVQGAAAFREVLQRFTHWCGEMDYIIFSWSDNDLLQILQETTLKEIADTPQLSYMYHHWKDFQQEYCELFPMDHVMSLQKAMDYCGLEFKGRAHDGLNDARATADLYRAIHDKESFEEFREKVLDCFRPKSISHTLADLFDFSAFQTAVSGTCGVKGCYRSAVYGGNYCSSHTCSKYNCKNLAVDGGYCSRHHSKAGDPYDVYDFDDPEDFHWY